VTFKALSDDRSRKKFEKHIVHLVQKAKDKDRKFVIMLSSLYGIGIW